MEVGKDTKECFAEMSKYRKMQDRLRSQMMQLDSPELQESMEELWHRNCKTVFHKVTKHNGFKSTFKRVFFSFAWAPLDYGLTLEKTHILQFLHCRLRHFALTPARRKICNYFIFNLGLVLLGSHLNVTSLGSGTMRGVNGWHEQLGTVNLNLTAARYQEDKNPGSYRTGLYGLWWQFRECLEVQRMVFSSRKVFVNILPRVLDS